MSGKNRKNEVREIIKGNLNRMQRAGESHEMCARWIHNDLDEAGFLATRNHVREYEAMQAVMEHVDPATIPGLTADQRVALAGFAKPQGGDSSPSRVDEGSFRALARWAIETLVEVDPSDAAPQDWADANHAAIRVILGLGYALGDRQGKSGDFWNAFLFNNPDYSKALSTLGDTHALSDEAIKRFFPDVITNEGKSELRSNFDALMVRMYGFERQQWMGDQEINRWYSHDGALKLIGNTLTVTVLSYEEAVLLYVRARGFIRDNAPTMTAPITGGRYEDSSTGNSNVRRNNAGSGNSRHGL